MPMPMAEASEAGDACAERGRPCLSDPARSGLAHFSLPLSPTVAMRSRSGAGPEPDRAAGAASAAHRGPPPYAPATAEDRPSGTGEILDGLEPPLPGMTHWRVDAHGPEPGPSLRGWVRACVDDEERLAVGDWASTWGVPVALPVAEGLSMALTTEMGAVVGGDRHQRHMAYGVSGGLMAIPDEALSVTVELAATREDDPEGRVNDLLSAFSAALMLAGGVAVNAAIELSLQREDPDHRIFIGVLHSF